MHHLVNYLGMGGSDPKPGLELRVALTNGEELARGNSWAVNVELLKP
jgi:hypothetical protein